LPAVVELTPAVRSDIAKADADVCVADACPGAFAEVVAVDAGAEAGVDAGAEAGVDAGVVDGVGSDGTAESAMIVMESVVLLYCDELSFTLTVNVLVEALLGVPEMTPLLLRLSPAGRLPEKSAHEYGAVPPEDVSDCE